MQFFFDLLDYKYGAVYAALLVWFLFSVIGTLTLYIGYGFVMSAVKSRNEGKSQRVVLIIDGLIASPFVLLDILLNIFTYSFVCLDFRPKKTLCTITSRMSQYNRDTEERSYRRSIANFFAALLDGKDPSGDHIDGSNDKIKWLD